MPVTVNTDLPLHDDRSREWDGDAARAAMARRCAADDGVMSECMGRGFVWRDPDSDAATIGAYDLPVADVIGGDLQLVLSGVQAAANSISPAREPGGPRALEASEGELDQMRSAVETILARFASEFDDETIRAPWNEDTATETASAGTSCSGCQCGQATNTETTEPAAPEEAAMPQIAPVTAPRSRVLRASATGGEWRPPLDHFANPHLTEPTKLTVTADGQVYGHLATWDQPHIGYDGKLIYPPRNVSGDYEYFRQSRVVTADGSALAVGLITMNTGHADESLSADAAASHYDNTGTMVAACNIGEDSIGIWLAGSMLPDVSPHQRTRFSLARVSGDWRQPQPGHPLELIAALSVPNPGFPVRQSPELLASDRMTLAASGLPAVVLADMGEIRTFISAGAAVIDETQTAAFIEAMSKAMAETIPVLLAGPLAGQIKTAVAEALAAQTAPGEAPAAAPAPGVEDPVPVQEQEEASPAPAAGEGSAEGDGGEQTAASESAPSAEESEPATAASEAAPTPGETVAASLAARARAHKARSVKARLLAAAGGRAKKA